MNNDILPPWHGKTNTHRKPSEKIRQALSEVSIKQAQEETPLPPIDLAEELQGGSRRKVSIKNIRANIRPKHWYNLNGQEKFVLFFGIAVVLISAASSVFLLLSAKETAVPTPAYIAPKVKPIPKPTTVAAPLTGLQIDPALAKRPVTAIMIENSLDARPQSGLQDAGVVYEAIAEGGVTRFMGLFQDTRPQYIGPVRSLRPYYIDFATPWDASIAHVGGSPDALAQIRSGGKDLDQFFNSGAYWRINTRYAPHNVYTSFDRLDALNTSKGYTASTPQSWSHKADEPLKVPTAKSIDFNISGYYYNPHYDYDAGSNTYLRSESGKPHLVTTSQTDKAGMQLHPKVVIALVVPLTNGALDSSGAYYSNYSVTGSGHMYVFQDGGVTEGTWTKTGRSSQFKFTDSAGNDLKLDAGQAWVTIVSATSKVTFKP